jgi:hypothetical protein
MESRSALNQDPLKPEEMSRASIASQYSRRNSSVYGVSANTGVARPVPSWGTVSSRLYVPSWRYIGNSPGQIFLCPVLYRVSLLSAFWELGGPPSPAERGVIGLGRDRQLGMPEIFHGLRHTHASQLIASGVDIVTISKRLGHAKRSVTLATYAYIFHTDDSKAAAAIDAALNRPT